MKLAKTVKEYCDVTERDGCLVALVALDQEKAYDRIDHAYLWKILECFALPPSFIAKIKALYANAETRVLVNQTESQPFPVKRGGSPPRRPTLVPPFQSGDRTLSRVDSEITHQRDKGPQCRRENCRKTFCR